MLTALLILFLTTRILVHATARALRIRERGRWGIEPTMNVPEVLS